MTTYTNTQGTYNRLPEGESSQRIQSWALIEAARKIALSIEAGADNDREVRKKRREALRLNWHLWTIFQAELTTADENFPDDIRINVLTLCQFIDKHTVTCLAEPLADKMSVLIDINRNIAAGLASMPLDEDNPNVTEALDEKHEQSPKVPTSEAIMPNEPSQSVAQNFSGFDTEA